MPIVSITQVTDDILLALKKLLQPFLSKLSLSGKSVLIKPNLVEPEHYTTGQTTNPALIEALIVWCREHGVADLAIGEGPNYFQPKSALRECFTATGVAQIAQKHHVPWIVFDEGPFREFRNHSPRTPRVFAISEHAFTWDHIINVPVPKPHYLTRVSIGMKNLKGFIRREDKPSFHHVGKDGIHGSVTELNLLIRPSLTVVDGTAPVHHNKNFLLAGTDIVAVDAVTTSLMGINPRDIGTIRMGYEAGLGEMDIEKIEIHGDDLKNFHMNLEQPEDYLTRAFPNLHLNAHNACSGCLIPLFASLYHVEKEHIKVRDEISLVLGKGQVSTSARTALFIGECTQRQAENAPWLKGCPPTKEELFEFLRNNMKQ